MFQQYYDDIAQDTASTGRAMERLAFQKCITLLEKAQTAGTGTREAVDALHFVNRLWTVLLDDLALPDNGLPKELRGKLISIGIWVLKRAAAIRDGVVSDFQALIDVCRTVAAGLQVR